MPKGHLPHTLGWGAHCISLLDQYWSPTKYKKVRSCDIYTTCRTLYLTSTDDTTNQVLQLRTLPQDEHYVSDVATQQDGVPQLITDTLTRPLPSVSNLPNDYDNSPQATQGVISGLINQQAQSSTTSSAAAATQNTGETISVPLQEGRYQEIVRYTNGSQFHDVVQHLESLLLENGPNNVTFGMFQAELDAFYRDGRDIDFTFAPNVYDSLEFLHHTYCQYEFEVDFPGLHIDCDSGEEKEDLEDTLPYEEPPPPYNEVRGVQNTIGVSSDQGMTQSILSRPDLMSNQTQARSTNLPQLDGPSESTDQYVSAATSPSHWREYPIDPTGTQILNWDLTGDQLYQTQSAVGDIQCRNINFEQDHTQDCRDREHCTNQPFSTQGHTISDIPDTDNPYDEDDTESYDTMDTHLRPPDDFFFQRYIQNLQCPQVGAIAQSTFRYNAQPDYVDNDLYATNRGRGAARGTGRGAGRGGNRGARTGRGAQAPSRGGA